MLCINSPLGVKSKRTLLRPEMASPTTLCPENGTNIMTSYGYSLLGSFFSSAIWGASSLQVFIYFMNSADSDPTAVNVLIACLWVLDTVNEILVLKSNWPVLILNYGKLAGLLEIQPYAALAPSSDGELKHFKRPQ
ncbi:hypothetical protein D9615_000801 [Tricholomella constricta]|uniref:Uncharacterized protein n=1 Tax=Tricholomella constricta TaxID=117010 RepID=A0A8H5HRT2_9AGAR|nr:hypothetical protein D9615_000801 [Tricholomella constricta]